MKVLQLAPLFQPLGSEMTYGSIERLVMLLGAGLTSAGYETIHLALQGSHVLGELVPIGSASYETQVGLALEMAEHRSIDVIHVHRREFFEMGGPARIRMLGRPIRIVATLHGPPERLRRLYVRHADKAHFVFVSAAQASGLPELWGTVIRNAIDVSAVPFHADPAQPPYLCHFGRVGRAKGTAEAIELSARTALPLKIAGVVQPGDREYFEVAVRPRLAPGRVEFLGPLGDHAKYALIGASSALALLPTYDDPCPLVVIEALACGTPVVGLSRGGLAELVRDGVTGLLAADISSLARKLSALGKISRTRCREVAAAEFDVTRLTEDYLEVYRGSKRPSSARET